MKTSPLAVAYREVRHFQPDDWLHCEPIAVRGVEMDWTIPAHRHDGLHQFLFLSAGAAEAVLDDIAHRVQAPALLMIAPGCVHAFRYAPGSAGRQITVPSGWLGQALAGAPELAARLPVAHVLHGDDLAGESARVAAMYAALEAEFEGSAPGRSEALRAHLVLIVTWVLRHAAPLPAGARWRARRDTLVQRYRGLLELHLRRHRPLGYYAAQLDVTPDHLSRSCRAVTGLSALDLLHERMLLEARRLLAGSAAPVTDVARALGYDDPSYFTRFFARRAGQSPLAYRAALQAGRAVAPGNPA